MFTHRITTVYLIFGFTEIQQSFNFGHVNAEEEYRGNGQSFPTKTVHYDIAKDILRSYMTAYFSALKAGKLE